MTTTFRWEDLLAEVAKRIPAQQFCAWLGTTAFVELNERYLVMSVPTSFSQIWITDHYREIFTSALQQLYGLNVDLKVEIDETLGTAKPDSRAGDQESLSLLDLSEPAKPSFPGAASNKGGSKSKGSPKPTKETEGPPPEPSLFDFGALENQKDGSGPEIAEAPSVSLEPVAAISVHDLSIPVIKTLGQPLDPKHTFETFVVGASNQFAHAAARAVAEQLANQYNPLFIYSDAGLGKTHLLHAIGNYALRVNPKSKICYISAETFTNDLIDSIQNGRMSQFRERYRDSYDILLMDDIQFIAGKDRTQEEFFHTFNALHSSKRQIVVTSDKFPKDIPGLEERIRTRFEWGLVADIQPPEIETRIAILRAKAEMDDIFLPNDVALFLASNIKSNIRELEGCLLRLGAQASLAGSEVSLDLAKQVLRNIIKEPTATITADAIQDAVARHFAIKVSDIRSKERSRRVALPRQITMYLIRKYCDKSYPDIGILLGGKDHSTVQHGVKTIITDMERDPEIRRHVEAIQNSL